MSEEWQGVADDYIRVGPLHGPGATIHVEPYGQGTAEQAKEVRDIILRDHQLAQADLGTDWRQLYEREREHFVMEDAARAAETKRADAAEARIAELEAEVKARENEEAQTEA